MNDQWTQEAYPAVPPDEKFRHDLQRALEQTHRQQLAQRKLHTQPAAKRAVQWWRLAALLALLLALAAAWRWLQVRPK